MIQHITQRSGFLRLSHRSGRLPANGGGSARLINMLSGSFAMSLELEHRSISFLLKEVHRLTPLNPDLIEEAKQMSILPKP